MAIKWKITHKRGKYTTAEGEEKTSWQNCGVILESTQYPGSFYMKLEYLPLAVQNSDGSIGIWFNLFDPQGKQVTNTQQQQTTPPPAQNPSDQFDDDIPF